MLKKKQEIVIKINDHEQISKYIAADYNKLVCINVYDKFWGSCEVMDPMVKKFLENKDSMSKVDFISSEKEITKDMFNKYSFTSKPKFFILHKGVIVSYIDGLDFPKLQEDIEKSFYLLDSE